MQQKNYSTRILG